MLGADSQYLFEELNVMVQPKLQRPLRCYLQTLSNDLASELGGGEWTCCLVQLLLSDFLIPCYNYSILSHPFFYSQAPGSPIPEVSLIVGSLESVFLGQREGLGSGVEDSPKDQEGFLVMELGMAGRGVQFQ